MTITKLTSNKNFQIALVTSLFIALIGMLSNLLPPAVDFHGAFRPAALGILRGESPYNASGFIYPPWTSVLMLPFAIFPEEIGRALLFLAYLFGVGYTTYKLSGNKTSTILILCSPPVIHGLLNGNIDGLVILGFVLPTWLGLFLLVIKPQLTFAYIIFIFIETLRKGKLRGAVKAFAPVTIAYILSLIIFGFWPINFSATIGFSHNANLWPLSIPIGLVLLVISIKRREAGYSIMASPFMSPYVLFHSWIVTFIPLASSTYQTAAAVLGIWVVFFLQYSL